MNNQIKEGLLYQLDKRVDLGLITRKKHKTLPLLIYTYTQACQSDGNWDDYTMRARGLVVDVDGNIIASPFKKFFNLEEPSCPGIPDLPYIVFEKLDGSLITMFNYEGVWHYATKGSFDNEYIDFAKGLEIPIIMPSNYTVSAEVCLPQSVDGMQRAVAHEPGLYLLGGFDLFSNTDLVYDRISPFWLGKHPVIYDNTIEELIERTKEDTGTEGWVVRFSNGLRIKVKTLWYLKVFRLISKLESTIVDKMIMGLTKNEILLDVPEELKNLAKQTYNIVYQEARLRQVLLEIEMSKYRQESRKEFALSIQTHKDRSYLFSLFDNKNIMPKIIEEVYAIVRSREKV